MLVPPGMVNVTVQQPSSTVPWKPPVQELFVV